MTETDRAALMRDYHDTEWGMPVTSERGLFERLCLEGFQSGLSWATILARRPRFRRAFAAFDPGRVAAFDDADLERLADDPTIIRHRGKIASVVNNARRTIEVRHDSEAGGLARLIWSHRPAQTVEPDDARSLPTETEESRALARELKRRGFTFVGPVTAWALMLAVGTQDPHAVGSPRRGASGLWSGREWIGGASTVPDVADGAPYAPPNQAPGVKG